MDLMCTFLIILTFSKIHSFPTRCSDNEWQCSDGTCIAGEARCDNFPDCSDGSDELKCTVSPVCLEGLESCPQPNGTTICVQKAVGCGCETVPNISNGAIVTTSILIGSLANVKCDAGYLPSVSAILCQKTGLWETASCKPKDCGPISSTQFGVIRLADMSNTTYGALGFVACDVGYGTNKPNVTCQENGRWTSAVCSLKDCRSPPDISFGYITLENNNISTVGATASVTCVDNYTPSKPTIICLETGIWEHVSCNLAGCGKVSIIKHGQLKFSEESTFGSFATVECDAGYKASVHTVKCQTTGDWDVAECIPKDCGSQQEISLGNIILQNSSVSTVGATALVSCIDDHTPSKPIIQCLETGVWEQATCDLSGCGSGPLITHGHVKPGNDTTFGSFTTVECDAGYKASVHNVICQTTGDWDVAECLPMDCGSPPNISFGTIILHKNSISTVGARAFVTCVDDYIPSNPTITCLESGIWEQASCNVSGCMSPPKLDHGTLEGIRKSIFGSFADVNCDVGYKPKISPVSCQGSGRWETPICTPIDCGQVPDIPFANVQLTDVNNTTYGASAHVTCNKGFETFTSTIKCKRSSVWQTTSCKAKGHHNRDECTKEHGICTKETYEHVRLRALKSSKCRIFCQCVQAGTLMGGVGTYRWAEHYCPVGTLFDDNLRSPVCNHQFLVSC